MTKIKIFIIAVSVFTSLVANAQEPAASSTSELPSTSSDVVTASTGKVPMTLKWNKLEDVTSYNVTISRFKDFKESRSFKTSKNYLPVMVFPNSHYFWKISALDDDEQVVSQREVFEFDVKEKGSATAQIDRALAPVAKTVESKTIEVSEEDKAQAEPIGVSQENSPRSEEFRRELPDYEKKGFEIKLGTELGVINLKQSHTTFGDVQVSGLLFPALALSMKSPEYFNFFYVSGFFQQTIGDFDSDDAAITLEDTDFQWLRYGLKGNFNVYKTDRFKISTYVGIDQQKSPYFFTLTPTSMTIKDIDYLSGVIGARFEMNTSGAWTYHADIAYAQPFSEKGDGLTSIDTTSALFVDAEVGATYKTTSGLFLGGAVRANMRDVDETLVNATSTSTGSRESTYFGLEVNAGISF